MDNALLLSYEEKSRYNDVEAIIYLADYYLDNHEEDKAFDMLKKFERLEDKVGYRKLAYLYENGKGTKANKDQAIEFYKKALDLGDLSAGYNLALLYLKEKDYPTAIQYLSNGRFNGHLGSTKVLADLYRLGLGVNKNEEIAIRLYQEALEGGDNSLYDQIGVIYYKNNNYLEAVKYFQKGANALDKNALYHLGICYSKGEGVYLDMQKAISYFELAAKQGERHSLHNLSMIYDRGIGVSIDKDKASYYRQKYESSKKI